MFFLKLLLGDDLDIIVYYKYIEFIDVNEGVVVISKEIIKVIFFKVSV